MRDRLFRAHRGGRVGELAERAGAAELSPGELRFARERLALARTVAAISGLKMPAARPIDSIVSTMPENDLV